MNRMLRLLLVAAVCVTTSSGLYAQGSASAVVDIGRLMTANEFKEAGLIKLSDAEIRNLNTWLSKFASQVLQVAKVSPSGACSSAIETQIEGTFNGWDGETIFKLANGQIWQQSSYAYTYHYAYRPDVTIYSVGGGCKMKVEDVDDTISVNRIR